ncbi:MAG: DUF4124 domain-containing protein [Gammaproteobacteria bacterium]|nr:DUF4124 domain-containing protein [Gammaproteobacteria bacterium]MBU1654708.1 DUF4124 domain-containing protein [Gammaproteobacteria bacterium]MBU1959629.1 DUF4124 domain-containing protein [Gammaproteobacteria bacterium]
MTGVPPRLFKQPRQPANIGISLASIAKRPLFFALLFMGAGIVQAGQIYRWVDAEGTSHFGDRPQRDVATQEVQLRPLNSIEGPKASRQKQQQKLLESYDRGREEKAKTEAAGLRQQALKVRQCAKMRQTLEYYERSSILFEKQADGSKRFLDNKDRDAEVAHLKAAIASECR